MYIFICIFMYNLIMIAMTVRIDMGVVDTYMYTYIYIYVSVTSFWLKYRVILKQGGPSKRQQPFWLKCY